MHPKKKKKRSTANLDGGFKLEQNGLLKKNVSGYNTKLFDFRLRELNLLSRSG